MNPPHPYHLTREEWNRQREECQANVAQCAPTKADAIREVARVRKLNWLLFGVRDPEQAVLSAAQRGAIVISPECAREMVDIINTPIQYEDVIAKAIREGLLPPMINPPETVAYAHRPESLP